MKKYAVRFRGTSAETVIEAYSAHHAKTIFANNNGLSSRVYIQARLVK